MEWEDRVKFPSKEQWLQSFRNEEQFVTHLTKNTTRRVVEILFCFQGKKVGWDKCPHKLRVENLQRMMGDEGRLIGVTGALTLS